MYSLAVMFRSELQ